MRRCSHRLFWIGGRMMSEVTTKIGGFCQVCEYESETHPYHMWAVPTPVDHHPDPRIEVCTVCYMAGLDSMVVYPRNEFSNKQLARSMAIMTHMVLDKLEEMG